MRDVLTDPRIAACSKFPLSLEGVDLTSGRWPKQPAHTFAGPIYSASYEEWRLNARSEDRALVVLRDPRDMVISLVFSLSFSHMPSAITRLLRPPLASASNRDRIRIGMHLLTQWASRIQSWSNKSGDRMHVARYEELLQDPTAMFGRMCDFLAWKIPEAVLHQVVSSHSFEARTGRKPGEVNEFSHYRKGISGDWRNYFDRELANEFESTFPGLLTGLGYESSNAWPDAVAVGNPEHRIDPCEARATAARLAVLEQENVELNIVRLEAARRLEDVETLTRLVGQLQAQVCAPHPEAEQRLADVLQLTDVVESLRKDLAASQATAEERLRAMEKLTATIVHMRGESERNCQARLSDSVQVNDQAGHVDGQTQETATAASERSNDVARTRQRAEAADTAGAQCREQTSVLPGSMTAEQISLLEELDRTGSRLRAIEHRLPLSEAESEQRLLDAQRLHDEIENERARVERIRLIPGGRSPTCSH